MKLFTNEQNESYKNAKICYICKEKFEDKYVKDKKCHKIRDQCHYAGEHRGVAHSICNLKYIVPQEIAIILHNGSNNDYHFIIKQFAEQFEGQFTCSEENTQKDIIFSVPIEREVTRISKNGE